MIQPDGEKGCALFMPTASPPKTAPLPGSSCVDFIANEIAALSAPGKCLDKDGVVGQNPERT